MKPLRHFIAFIESGVVKRQKPDRLRANFLIKEAEQNNNYLLKLIEKMGVDDLNANDYVKKCYDILMSLIRAKMLLVGLNASGFQAHEAEVSYIRELNFSESDVQFVNQMRYFRNGMIYYGTILDKEYAEKVLAFTKMTYVKMKEILKNK